MKKSGTHNYIKNVKNENIKIFINGNLYKRKDAKISVFDSGFLLGDGVWEGIRLINNKLLFLQEHLNRLFLGAKKLEIDIGHTKKELEGLIKNTLEANNMQDGVHIRLIISRGIKKTPYQHPNANLGNCSIVIIPEYKEADIKKNNSGIRLVTVTTKRGTAETQDPQLNTLSKHNCIAACIEAKNAAADEGIMLDLNNFVSTCNSTNFFIIKNKEVWTSTGDFCLPGITRRSVIEICKENNIPIFEKNFRIQDVHSADESFVTGTFSGIIPVIEIDLIKMSNGTMGTLTRSLQKLYEKKIND
tara:strand:- start:650 stop:1555 length:906 start_codon:yes stop_codon:yes gene_type:complete